MKSAYDLQILIFIDYKPNLIFMKELCQNHVADESKGLKLIAIELPWIVF